MPAQRYDDMIQKDLDYIDLLAWVEAAYEKNPSLPNASYLIEFLRDKLARAQ